MASSPRSKRSRDETRELMLAAGAELVYEAFGDPEAAGWAPVAHVRLTDVAIRASEISRSETAITTGAIYPIWEDQDAYRRDLVLHLLSPKLVRNQERWTAFADLLASDDRPPTIEGMVDVIATATLEAVASDPYYYVLYVLMPYSAHTAIRDALDEYIAAEQGHMAWFYRFGLMAYGRQMQNPHTHEDLTEALVALFNGMVLAQLTATSRASGTNELSQVLADSAKAIVMAFSEPQPESTSPRSD